MNTNPPRHTPFAALRHRDYRLLWSGQLISQTGSTMQSVAINWHIAVLTNFDPFALGLLGLSKVVPIVLFSLIGGAMADARDRRKLMIVTQSAMALFAAILGLLTDRGLSIVWPIYVLSAMSSAAWAFDNPARQALVPSLVPRENLANAMSLNSMMFQTATIVGPVLAGLIIGSGNQDILFARQNIVLADQNIAVVYWINAVSFLAVIVALLFMRPVKVATRKVDLGSVREGLSFVRHQPIIWSTMALDFFATFFSSASQLLPIFAAKILNVGAQGFGILEAAPAIGALLSGGTMSVVVMRIKRPGAVILWSVALYGVATVAFGLSASFWLSLICLGLTGIADNVSTILRSTIRQLVTPDHIRGRMTSVNMIFFMGGPQLGELEAGVVAALIGAPLSVVTGGLGCLLAVAVVARKVPMLRRFDQHDLRQAGEALAVGAVGK